MPKILIVDDEPDIRENLEVALKTRGFETILAATGPQAVDEALKNRPDLVLLDVMLPELDGMSVCKRIKALASGFMPVILVTALGTLHDKQVGEEHGADDYLVKPYKIEELMTRIGAMLRIKAVHDDLKK